MRLEAITPTKSADFESTDPELLVQERLHKEQIEQPPEDLAALSQATFNCLDQLYQKNLHDQTVGALILDVNNRLERYLSHARYAESILNTNLKKVEQQARANMHEQLVAEVNPLLCQLSAQLNVPGDQLLQNLSVGELDNHQRTTTIFKLIPGFSCEKPSYPRKLVILDPLSQEPEILEYWRARIKQRELYSEAGEASGSLPELCYLRTQHAIYELTHLQSRLTEEKAAQACVTLIAWLEAQSTELKDVTNGQFKKYLETLDFIHGESDEIFQLLNAAETLKQTAPELFVRLVGLAPSYGPAKTAAKSELFGNVFHIALKRSQTLAVLRRDQLNFHQAGLAVLGEAIDQLTDFDRHLPLLALNDEQMRHLEAQLPGIKQKIIDDPNAAPIYIAALFPLTAGYELKKLLDSVSLAEKEETLKQIRAARPKELLRLIKKLSKEQLEDIDIKTALKARRLFSHISIHLDKNFEASRDIDVDFNNDPDNNFFTNLRSINTLTLPKDLSFLVQDLLWQTTPDAELLEGGEFADFLKQLEAELETEYEFLQSKLSAEDINKLYLSKDKKWHSDPRLLRYHAYYFRLIERALKCTGPEHAISLEAWRAWRRRIKQQGRWGGIRESDLDQVLMGLKKHLDHPALLIEMLGKDAAVPEFIQFLWEVEEELRFKEQAEKTRYAAAAGLGSKEVKAALLNIEAKPLNKSVSVEHLQVIAECFGGKLTPIIMPSIEAGSAQEVDYLKMTFPKKREKNILADGEIIKELRDNSGNVYFVNNNYLGRPPFMTLEEKKAQIIGRLNEHRLEVPEFSVIIVPANILEIDRLLYEKFEDTANRVAVVFEE